MAIDSVRKALEIVDLLSSKRGGYSLTEIASELLIAVSTVYKQLQSLVELGLVHKDPHTGRYFITYKIVELSSRILKNLEFRDIARPFLIELLEELRMTVHLVVRENLRAVYVEKIEGPYTIPTISRMGMQIDLYSTSVGKAILAYSPEEFIEEYLSKVDLQKKTPRTIINPVELRTELTRVKGRGYALDNEENEFGICCIGSPIFDHNNNVFAALSVTAASQQFLPESITKTANCVLQKARNISIALGCSI
jgi:DNA-binding IclR family transcriptional regulator